MSGDQTAEALLAQLARVASQLAPVVAPPGSDDLLRALTDTARQVFGARACSLALLSDDGSELVYTTAAGSGAEGISGLRMPASRGIAGWVVMSGQAVAIDDLRNDVRFAQDVAEGTGYVPNAMLAVPVVSPRRLLGVMTLLDRDADRPGAEADMALLTVFADQAALALEAADAVRDVGRLLLGAVAVAAGEGTDLAAAATAAAADAGPDASLAELAALLAQLDTMGPAEHRLAVRLVRDVLSYAERRQRRPGS